MPTVYSLRAVLRMNAKNMRKAGMYFADYRAAYKARKELSKQSVAALRALGYNTRSLDPVPVDVIESLDTTPLIRENNRKLEHARAKAIEHMCLVQFPTKQQQQRITRMFSVIVKHNAAEDAQDEADWRDQAVQEEKNFKDCYSHAVKHGHVDPRRVSLEDCKHAWDNQTEPGFLPPLPRGVTLAIGIIVGLATVVLYNLTH